MSALVYYITVLGLFSTVVIGVDPTELKYQNIYMVLALSLGYPTDTLEPNPCCYLILP